MPAHENPSLLTLLAARCVACLPRRSDAQRLLSDAIIIDAATIAVIGVDAGDKTLLDDLTNAQRQQLTVAGLLRRSASILSGSGFVISTRDPRDYDAFLGFVKIKPGQWKQKQIGAPVGPFRSRSANVLLNRRVS